MRWSKLFIPTTKENPAAAESASHRLLLRGGFIRGLGSGIYSLLPLAYKVRLKIINIIRQQMTAISAQEFLLPALHPAEVWQETGRLETMGEIMFKLKDRKGAALVLGTTHEEIFTAVARDGLSSYRQLPQIWYQFQTKFRDELRPKAGLLRVREFTMKDSYSFDLDFAGLDQSFEAHREAYCNTFSAVGLPYLMVEASSGAMGGSQSVEFMLLTDSGEDLVVTCSKCQYAANLEKAIAKPLSCAKASESAPLEKFATPAVRTIEDLAKFNGGAAASSQIKTLVYSAAGSLKLLLLRGDHELNLSKLAEVCHTADLRPATEEEIFKALGAHPGSLGAVAVNSTDNPQISEVIGDSVLQGSNQMVTGANIDDFHYRHVSVERDMTINQFADLRVVKEGEGCSLCDGALRYSKGLEIGHIFKLGLKYSESMGAHVLDSKGERCPLVMGSYGIGVERLMAACVESSHDEKGIIWHPSIAPFQVVVTPTDVSDSAILEFAEDIYKQLQSHNIDVLLDDRSERAGIKFAESELIGIPYRLTVGKKLSDGKVELLTRKGRTVEEVAANEAVAKILTLLSDH
ncbi:proline--tRNA ligase [soil metagenome]